MKQELFLRVCELLVYLDSNTRLRLLVPGLDASRALAKMSFDPADVNSRDLSDLTPEQLKVRGKSLRNFSAWLTAENDLVLTYFCVRAGP